MMLHVDHVGWNTIYCEDEWRPTFPNARYYFSAQEYTFYQHPENVIQPSIGALEDRVVPVSGPEFTVPAASYADKPIPHFAHSGTGYQLLASLGRAFSINDYIWYQLPDGGVFAGSAADALFAGKLVEIPSEFSLRTAVQSTGKTTVLGKATLLAGAIQQIAQGITVWPRRPITWPASRATWKHPLLAN